MDINWVKKVSFTAVLWMWIQLRACLLHGNWDCPLAAGKVEDMAMISFKFLLLPLASVMRGCWTWCKKWIPFPFEHTVHQSVSVPTFSHLYCPPSARMVLAVTGPCPSLHWMEMLLGFGCRGINKVPLRDMFQLCGLCFGIGNLATKKIKFSPVWWATWIIPPALSENVLVLEGSGPSWLYS